MRCMRLQTIHRQKAMKLCHYCRRPFEPVTLFGFIISACCGDECTAKQLARCNAGYYIIRPA